MPPEVASLQKKKKNQQIHADREATGKTNFPRYMTVHHYPLQLSSQSSGTQADPGYLIIQIKRTIAKPWQLPISINRRAYKTYQPLVSTQTN